MVARPRCSHCETSPPRRPGALLADPGGGARPSEGPDPPEPDALIDLDTTRVLDSRRHFTRISVGPHDIDDLPPAARYQPGSRGACQRTPDHRTLGGVGVLPQGCRRPCGRPGIRTGSTCLTVAARIRAPGPTICTGTTRRYRGRFDHDCRQRGGPAQHQWPPSRASRHWFARGPGLSLADLFLQRE